MAVQAVIDEDLGAVLQGGLIIGLVRALVQMELGPRSQRQIGANRIA
jgi:hypothetical protein